MGLEGVEIFLNPSGSHHQLRKLDQRIRLLCEATTKNGGVYLYSNHRGCDGNRLYFDGASMIVANGEILKVGSQFSLKDVEVVSCVVDLNQITSKRIAFKSRAIQAASGKKLPRVEVPLIVARIDSLKNYDIPVPLRISDIVYKEEEEIAYGPACYLFDFLRRTKASGFFLPLSGGADSAAVATIVYNLAILIWEELSSGNKTVADTLKNIVNEEGFAPKSPKDIMAKILFTCYMGSENSSQETLDRAQNLSEEIGSIKKANKSI
jgi:NAD+ synthase (glutamine-hydrolysing)